MAGEGFMMHAIKSLQANRAQLKDRRAKAKYGDHTLDHHGQLAFKKVDAATLERLKADIRTQARRGKRRYLGLMSMTLLLLIAVSLWLIYG